MDILVLQGAIVALFGVVSALAKVAWSERALRMSECESQLAYYREKVVPTLERVLDSSEAQQKTQERLTTIIEERMRDA